MYISLLLVPILAGSIFPGKTKFYITTRDDFCIQGPYDANHLGNYRRAGDVEASRYQLTLGLGKPDRAGALWSNTPITAESWQVTLTFNIKGQDQEHGGHGLAFWFTKEAGKLGPFYGNQAAFEGLALIADTYSGDEQPIFALLGGGQQQHFKMGDLSKAMGKCAQAIRNREHPVSMRLSWMAKSLKVEFDGQDGGQTWRTCMEVKDLPLPNEGYFGISSSTSKTADRVEILSMRVQEIHSADNNAELMHEIRRLGHDYDIPLAAAAGKNPPDHISALLEQTNRAQVDLLKRITALLGTIDLDNPSGNPSLSDRLHNLEHDVKVVSVRLERLSALLQMTLEELDSHRSRPTMARRFKSIPYTSPRNLAFLFGGVVVLTATAFFIHRKIRAQRPRKLL